MRSRHEGQRSLQEARTKASEPPPLTPLDCGRTLDDARAADCRWRRDHLARIRRRIASLCRAELHAERWGVALSVLFLLAAISTIRPQSEAAEILSNFYRLVYPSMGFAAAGLGLVALAQWLQKRFRHETRRQGFNIEDGSHSDEPQQREALPRAAGTVATLRRIRLAVGSALVGQVRALLVIATAMVFFARDPDPFAPTFFWLLAGTAGTAVLQVLTGSAASWLNRGDRYESADPVTVPLFRFQRAGSPWTCPGCGQKNASALARCQGCTVRCPVRSVLLPGSLEITFPHRRWKRRYEGINLLRPRRRAGTFTGRWRLLILAVMLALTVIVEWLPNYLPGVELEGFYKLGLLAWLGCLAWSVRIWNGSPEPDPLDSLPAGKQK